MTGSLEEDADAVIFVFRPEVYAQNEHEVAALKGKAVINLALNRHGAPWRDNKIMFKQETSYFLPGRFLRHDPTQTHQPRRNGQRRRTAILRLAY